MRTSYLDIPVNVLYSIISKKEKFRIGSVILPSSNILVNHKLLTTILSVPEYYKRERRKYIIILHLHIYMNYLDAWNLKEPFEK